MINPKHYQKEAVNNALEIFRHAESQLQAAQDAASRRTASAANGCVLLEAPTGAGKTLMAGLIAEAFARPDHLHNAKIVWFWFTPFANLVEQARGALHRDFTGLRMRDLNSERIAYSTQRGDVFVTTWQSVAAQRAETRRLRKNGDLSLSLDNFLVELRQAGFRVGVVVDEAHHGFGHDTEAMRFYREILQPDFTLLITATPDDADIEKFRKASGIGELHRIRVSRKDAVDAGLIKAGVRSIAYLAPDDQKALADIPGTALAEGWQTHQTIKQQLADIGVNLTPLMLVQVANKGKDGNHAIDEAKRKLLGLGVPEDAIASYTADEPNDDLLTVALDESKQVLLFKMAVAMGFDAPRAFTVVSMRGAKSVDFGIQVVGRILRVHRKLQGLTINNTLPDLLRFGYVFLADQESQGGLIGAGQKINAIETGLSAICNHALLVRHAGTTEVQYSVNGQMSLLPSAFVPPPWQPLNQPDTPNPEPWPLPMGVNETLPGFNLPWSVPETVAKQPSPQAAAKALPGNNIYPLRAEIPKQFQTERLPISPDELLKGIAAYKLDAEVLNIGLRKSIKIKRNTIEDIFSSSPAVVDTVQAKLSKAELARLAQRVLFDAQAVSPREAEAVMLDRLRLEYNELGGMELSEDELRQALHLILATYPSLLRDAERSYLANCKEVLDSASFPDSLEMPPGAVLSRLNGYGVMPQDLNEPERKFAELLDTDTSDTVLWWQRNEPRKPWSVALVLPGGGRYFPDFIIGVKGRTQGSGILLAEIKGGHILDSEETREKARAEHKVYGTPLLVTRKDDGKFWIARYIAKENRVEPDQAFRVEHLGQY